MQPTDQIIYDFGASNGDDIAYYLRKPYLVVAVEANPALCRQIEKRYANEIASGRLAVLCGVLSTGPEQGDVPFYLHRKHHVRGQFPKPAPSEAAQFDEIILPALSPLSIIARHGPPHYIKIDLEHYDAEVLRALFAAGIFPDYISAESHTVEVFCLLVATGHYRAFKMVEGKSVSTLYANAAITTTSGTGSHAFPHHSAGPYGNDISGPWYGADVFFTRLAEAGLGWKDIHASRLDAPAPPAPKAPAPVPAPVAGPRRWLLALRNAARAVQTGTKT